MILTTRQSFKPADTDRLQKALALIIGTEAMVVFRDVLELDEAEAREVTSWAIRVLIEGAETSETTRHKLEYSA